MSYVAVIVQRKRPTRLQAYVAKVKGMGDRGMGQDLGYGLSVTDSSTGDWTATDLQNVGGIGESSTPVSLSPTTTAPSTTSPSLGTEISQLSSALTSAAAGAEKLYLSAQSPSLIPGTNTVYNPATGTMYNATTGQVITAAGTAITDIGTELSSIMPTLLLWGGIALAAFLAIRLVEGTAAR